MNSIVINSRNEVKHREKVKQCQKMLADQRSNSTKTDPFIFEDVRCVGDIKKLIDPILNQQLNSSTMSKGDGTKLHWKWTVDSNGNKLCQFKPFLSNKDDIVVLKRSFGSLNENEKKEVRERKKNEFSKSFAKTIAIDDSSSDNDDDNDNNIDNNEKKIIMITMPIRS